LSRHRFSTGPQIFDQFICLTNRAPKGLSPTALEERSVLDVAVTLSREQYLERQLPGFVEAISQGVGRTASRD
jgi:hypothetical protein